MIKYFATFGSDHLSTFNINPLKVMVYVPYASETELCKQLQESPINNHYCTIYPIDRGPAREKQFGTYLISYDDLLLKQKL